MTEEQQYLIRLTGSILGSLASWEDQALVEEYPSTVEFIAQARQLVEATIRRAFADPQEKA